MRKNTSKSKVFNEVRMNLPLLLGILAFILLIWIYAPLMSAIAYGLLLAYLSRPLVDRLKPHIGLGWATFVSIFLIVVVVGGILSYTAYQATNELMSVSPGNMIDSFVKASNTVSKFAQKHPEMIPILNSLSKQLDKYTNMITDQAINLVVQLINLIITLVLSLVIAFFLVYDGSKIKNFLERALPKEVRSQLDRMDRNLYGIYVGSLLSALVVGIITTLTFLVFSLPYPFLAGALAAILQFIPMVGPQLFLIPGAIVAIIFREYLKAIVLFALAVFLFFVPDNAIKPVILKRTTMVHPLLVLLSFIGGVVVFGPPGFVIGPFVLVVADGLIHAWLGW